MTSSDPTDPSDAGPQPGSRGHSSPVAVAKPTPPGQWAPPPPEEIAACLPGYEVAELLGCGGMGAVYRGVQTSLDRPVAVKLLPPELGADPEFGARFAREAKSMARLNHPNIVQIYDYGRTGAGHHYIVMEYVDGADLHRHIHHGALEVEGALNAVSQICDALVYAHGEGFVHRDIKPANIFVNSKGMLKVGDFGLAKLVGGDDPALGGELMGLTVSGVAMGTPHYIAPEQLALEGAVDQRADIYSLGVLFYEMLTREIPRGHVKAPSQKTVGIDKRIDAVVFKAMETDPAERYQSAADLRADVDAIRTTPMPKASAGTGKERRSRKTSRRPATRATAGTGPRRSPALLAALVGLPLLLVIGGVALFAGKDKSRPAPAVETAEIAAAPAEESPSPRPDPPESPATAGLPPKPDAADPSDPSDLSDLLAVIQGRESFSVPGKLEAIGPDLPADYLARAESFDDFIQVSAGGDVGGNGVIWAALRTTGDVVLSPHPVNSVSSPLIDVALIRNSREVGFFFIHRDGRLTVSGESPQPDSGLRPVVDAAGGKSHALALHPDGSVTLWGPRYREWSIPEEAIQGVVSISASRYGALTVTSDGALHFWGQDTPYQRIASPEGDPFVKVVGIWLQPNGSKVLTRSGKIFITDGQAATITDFAGDIAYAGNAIMFRDPDASWRFIAKDVALREELPAFSKGRHIAAFQTKETAAAIRIVPTGAGSETGPAEMSAVPSNTRTPSSLRSITPAMPGKVVVWNLKGQAIDESNPCIAGIPAGLQARKLATLCNPVRSIDSPQRWIFALDAEGRLHAWGAGAGLLNQVTHIDGHADIAVGYHLGAALNRSGRLFVWGGNSKEWIIPEAPFVRFAIGADHIAAIDQAGQLHIVAAPNENWEIPQTDEKFVDVSAGDGVTLATTSAGTIHLCTRNSEGKHSHQVFPDQAFGKFGYRTGFLLSKAGKLACIDREGKTMNPPHLADLEAALRRVESLTQDDLYFENQGLQAVQTAPGTWEFFGLASGQKDLAEEAARGCSQVVLIGSYAFAIKPDPNENAAAHGKPATMTSSTPPSPPADDPIARIEAEFHDRFEAEILQPHRAAVKRLDNQILAALGRERAAAVQAGDLDTVLVWKKALDRLEAGQGVPSPEEIAAESPAAKRPARLLQFCDTYRTELAKLVAARDARLRPWIETRADALRQIEVERTQAGDLDTALRAKTSRENPPSPDDPRFAPGPAPE